jgi:site-specific DNA recombinase
LADLQERIRLAERRTAEINEEIKILNGARVSEGEVASALSVFDPVWESLTPREQARIVQLLVQHVDYDGADYHGSDNSSVFPRPGSGPGPAIHRRGWASDA